MQQEIERLKRKYIFSASAIVIAVIWEMLLVMNLLIQMLFRANSSNADAMILQAAKSYDYQTETLLLSEMEQNADGDYLIPRSIHSVDSITLSGTIRSDSDSESWYCGGGGLMYLEKTANQQELVYREYTFNKDTSEVTIDFQNDSTLKRERSAEARQTSGLTTDNFLVSIVWWTSREDVSLALDRITIHYLKERASNDILHLSYSDLFENQIPEVLSERNSFYLVTDSGGSLSAVCSGNLPTQISSEEAETLVSDVLQQHRDSGSISAQKSSVHHCAVPRFSNYSVPARPKRTKNTAPDFMDLYIFRIFDDFGSDRSDCSALQTHGQASFRQFQPAKAVHFQRRT